MQNSNTNIVKVMLNNILFGKVAILNGYKKNKQQLVLCVRKISRTRPRVRKHGSAELVSEDAVFRTPVSDTLLGGERRVGRRQPY